MPIINVVWIIISVVMVASALLSWFLEGTKWVHLFEFLFLLTFGSFIVITAVASVAAGGY